MLIVSACLAGLKCRYDGMDNGNPFVISLVKAGKALPLCPEQLGGLPTPRPPAEIIRDKVINTLGEDVSNNFRKGATETLRIAQLVNCKEAILKQRSPSCGCGLIYDGSHTGKLIAGKGITAQLLHANGINVKTEEDL